MEQDVIIYEQPLNEHVRVCLRLEYLFKQVGHYLDEQSVWGSHNALVAIIDILDVVDRPDVKSKLTNALRLHVTALARLQQTPVVDQSKLQEIMAQLDQCIDILHNTHGKLGQVLRENEFLVSIRQRLAVAGGTCDFVVPAYHLWQQAPMEKKQENLRAWFDSFKQLQNIVDLLLQLVREGALPKQKTASGGFYQETLPPDISYQMIRVVIPEACNIYPDISVGRHRLSIHFFKLNVTERSQQIIDDVDFELTCCKI